TAPSSVPPPLPAPTPPAMSAPEPPPVITPSASPETSTQPNQPQTLPPVPARETTARSLPPVRSTGAPSHPVPGTSPTALRPVRVHDAATLGVEAATTARAADGLPGGPKQGPPSVRVVDTLVKVVKSRRITLNFAFKDVGPSGVSAVELWYTQD